MAADNDLYFTPAQQKQKKKKQSGMFVEKLIWFLPLIETEKTRLKLFLKRDMSLGDVGGATSLDLC